ncbi:MAG: 30S ribosomal protein S8 [Candidatus Wolfebacteria bacterium]|nr:30S ribosomal protein S8 [Candidatus Wolfebacteria bacterium]
MYTDFLIKIKNAQAVKKESIKVPFSKMTGAIAEILLRKNLLESVEKKGRAPKKILEIKLKYKDGVGAISGLKFVSKPSRKIYAGYEDLKPVRHNFGFSVISTPKGILSGAEARKEKVGGELLFEIW